MLKPAESNTTTASRGIFCDCLIDKGKYPPKSHLIIICGVIKKNKTSVNKTQNIERFKQSQSKICEVTLRKLEEIFFNERNVVQVSTFSCLNT